LLSTFPTLLLEALRQLDEPNHFSPPLNENKLMGFHGLSQPPRTQGKPKTNNVKLNPFIYSAK